MSAAATEGPMSSVGAEEMSRLLLQQKTVSSVATECMSRAAHESCWSKGLG